MDSKKTVLIGCSAKGPENAAYFNDVRTITLVLEVDMESGVILNSDVTFIADLPIQFVKDILNEKKFDDIQFLRKEIQQRFYTPTKKTLLQALNACYKTYRMLKAGQAIPEDMT
jgi:hypothetical protein